MEIIKVKNITKIYNSNSNNPVKALSEINLIVNKGEFIAVMGPSGSGKTTLLNILATIIKPTSGQLLIDGNDISIMNEEQICKFRSDSIGFIYQNFNLIVSMTIYENIALPLAIANYDKAKIDEIIHATSKRLHIEGLLNKYPITCSGGQLQRIAIARALVLEPKFIVADEPTGNLDSNNSYEVMEILKELNNQGTTILLVTHNTLVASYADRVVFINDGCIGAEVVKASKDIDAYLNQVITTNYSSFHNQ